MNENVDNLILEQLRLIREDIRRVEDRLSSGIDSLIAKVDDLGDQVKSLEGILIGLGGYIRAIDKRVEHMEAKLGFE